MTQTLESRALTCSGYGVVQGSERIDGGILSSLREQTRSCHERVERAVNLPARLVSVERYRDLLARFHGYYAPVERQLAERPGLEALGLAFHQRKKTPLLRRDLIQLGYSADAIACLPRCGALPSIASLAEALGCLYVIEGSTLGGQIARREVKRLLNLETESGCKFFASYGEQVGARWKEFCGVDGLRGTESEQTRLDRFGSIRNLHHL